MRVPVFQPNQQPPPDLVVRGRCWVVDGDTIVIDKMHIRLAGIDAPELDHPWGRQSKWAMVTLCKGQVVTARLKPEMSYERVVAECFLPDGRDLAAELVKLGLALDWPKFSGGKYRHLEPADVRRRLWRANLRQSGVMWPADPVDVPVATRRIEQPYQWRHTATPAPAIEHIPPRRANFRAGWFAVFGVLVLLVGCNLVGSDPDQTVSASPSRPSPVLASFEVTAHVLNVRRNPTAQSSVIAQIGQGTTVTRKQISGAWYGVEMADGSTGWVHRDFLGPAGQ